MSKNELERLLCGIYCLELSVRVVDPVDSYKTSLPTDLIHWVFEPLSDGRKNELFPYVEE